MISGAVAPSNSRYVLGTDTIVAKLACLEVCGVQWCSVRVARVVARASLRMRLLMSDASCRTGGAKQTGRDAILEVALLQHGAES